MTITIPVWLIWVFGAYVAVGALTWVLLSRKVRWDAVTGVLALWPLVLVVWVGERGWFCKHEELTKYLANIVDDAVFRQIGPRVWIGVWDRGAKGRSRWVFLRVWGDHGFTIGKADW